MRNLVTVVTVTFDNFEELLATVRSLPRTPEIEHVVINGGSCPRTRAYLEQEFHGVSRSEPDGGIADAFNKGARLARGEGVAYLNSGDLFIGGDYYQAAGELLGRRPEVAFVHSNLLFRDALAGELSMRPTLAALGRGMPYQHPTMVVRRSVFERLGYFDTSKRIAMDFDFVCKLHAARLEGVYLDRPPVVCMDGTGVSARNELRAMRECYASLRAHGLLGLENRLGYLRRRGLHLVRSGMAAAVLKPVLAHPKRRKHPVR